MARTRGFSLIEVMFAGAILVVGLSAVAGVFSTARFSFAHHRDIATATAICEQFLEQVVILPPSNAILDDTTDEPKFFTRDGRETAATSMTLRTPFQLTWSIQKNTPITGIKKITADVMWVHNREHHVKLFTFRE